jgi:hypothetical protein
VEKKTYLFSSSQGTRIVTQERTQNFFSLLYSPEKETSWKEDKIEVEDGSEK